MKNVKYELSGTGQSRDLTLVMQAGLHCLDSYESADNRLESLAHFLVNLQPAVARETRFDALHP